VGKQFRTTKSPSSKVNTMDLSLETSPTTHNSFNRGLDEEFGTPSFGSPGFSVVPSSVPASPFRTAVVEATPKIDDAKSRLEVLWLRRKADLAMEDGDLNGALNLIQGALDEHLGGRDYKAARLSQPVISSDPAELLGSIQKDYFLFDTFAHRMAGILQRWYHRKHQRRCDHITLISKIFRGYLKRKAYKKYKEMRRQCAVLIQRRFRKHLIRMHALATLIKRWYRIRRIVKEFQKRLHIFRMARRIQALFRGYRGRRAAALKRLQFQLVNRIQRTARAYVVRRNRAYVIALFHQRFWRAARTIQTYIRKIQAVERCQIKLLLELSRENIRARKERVVVEEALRLQKIRNSYYFKTDAGKMHLQFVARQLSVKSYEVKRIAPELTEEQRVAAKIISVLEIYDTDGTGNIPTKMLNKVLKRLLIVVNKEQLVALKHTLDPDSTGQIAFSDVVDWYASPAADAYVEPEAFSTNLSMVRLQLSQQARKLNFSVSSSIARKGLNTQHAAWLTKDTIATFRMTHPPKYQCCQCRQAFVMFTDYYAHFDHSTGNCGVSGEKGMFYGRYWVKQDWKQQRAIEKEVIRCNDEQPYVTFQCKVAGCADLALLRQNGPQEAHNDLIHKTYDLLLPDALAEKKSGLKKFTVNHIKSLFTDCECNNVTDVVAERITKALYLPFSKQWITDELCAQNDMVKWLSKYTQDYADTDHSSFSDNSSSVKVSDFFKSDDPKASKHHVEFSLASKRVPTITDGGLKRQCARDLAVAQVGFLRALHVQTQSALFALMEFRARKPRR
jgi:hypothetical protein